MLHRTCSIRVAVACATALLLAGRDLRAQERPAPPLAHPEVTGSDTADSNTAGSNTAGSNTADSNTAGSNTAGSNTAGSNTAGSNTAGSNTAGSNTAGSNTAGSEMTRHDAAPREELISSEQLASWAAELDANRFAQRQHASDALANAGQVAVPYLQQAVQQGSLEAADRAVGVLQLLAMSSDRSLQQGALEALLAADRFPVARRQAERRLTELLKTLCQERFERLGASFLLQQRLQLGIGQVTRITITVDPQQWRGTNDEFLSLLRFQQLDELKLTAPSLDDATLWSLLQLPKLRYLELVQTKVSVEMVRKIRREHPDLRLVLRNDAKLGVRLVNVNSLVVSGIEPGSAAEKAGIQPQDTILQLNGNPVHNFDDLTIEIAQCIPGQELPVVVQRQGEQVHMTATLGSHDWSEENP